MESSIDFADIIGQEHVKRALEVALSGGHSALLIGAPGSGKSLLINAAKAIDCDCDYLHESRPCPCGYYGDPVHRCTCDVEQITKFRTLGLPCDLDHLCMVVEVPRLPVEKLMRAIGGFNDRESTGSIAARVNAARERQLARQGKSNGELTHAEIMHGQVLSEACQSLMTRAIERLGFSARNLFNVLRVARTIADLDGADSIEIPHLAEAIQYRAGEERLRG